jgi:hypothetical protein
MKADPVRISDNHRPKQPRPEVIAMAYHRISIGFVAAALLALPVQGLRADTTPKVTEEVDFAHRSQSLPQPSRRGPRRKTDG